MNINTSAPAVATHEVMIQAPPEKIWKLLTEINHWPDWNGAVKKAKLDGPFAVGTTFHWKNGATSIVSKIEEIEPMARLVWSGKALGTLAVHVWTMKLTTKGVLVSTTESFDGWLVNLLKKSMQGTLDHALIDWLYELKRKAEGN